MSNQKNIEIRKKAFELTKKIKQAETALDELRHECSHCEHCVKDISGGKPGAFKLMKVCKFCGKLLGFPNKKDLEDNGYA